MNFKWIFKKICMPVLLTIGAYWITSQDQMLYRSPIGIISSSKTIQEKQVSDDFQNRDESIVQRLTIKIINLRPKKNPYVVIINHVNASKTTGQLYHIGQKVVLKKMSGKYEIVTLKRDSIMIALIVLLISLYFSLTAVRSSSFLLLSLFLNLIYFVICIILNLKINPPVIALFSLLSVIFVLSSLVFVLGGTKQMVYTFLTTVLTTVITFLIIFITMYLCGNNGIHFEYLGYVTQDPSKFFFVGTIISVLGAIMDGSGDIVAGLFGLNRQYSIRNQSPDFKVYLKSGMSIGQEIIGTLTNVLFMIFIAETLPLTLLLLRNGNTWGYIATVGLNLGMFQAIISIIGILLSVPITSIITGIGLAYTKK